MGEANGRKESEPVLRKLSLQWAFLLATIVVMALATGAVYQFERSLPRMLEGLVPAWIGIGATFWALWRAVGHHRNPDDRP